jgi:hypothetical protein
MFNSCQNCAFAEVYGSGHSIPVLEKRILEMQEQIDKMEEDFKKEMEQTSVWNILPSYRYSLANNPVIRLRSRMWELQLELRNIREKMECRRYPDPKIVNKSYKCGEYKTASWAK